MSTYQDLTVRVRALIDDNPNHYADDNFLLPYVNMAQGQLVSALMANSVREAVCRATMMVPAGTSRIERWPVQATSPNEIPYSETFTLAGVPTHWAATVGGPAVSTGIADPEGGTAGCRWTSAGAAIDAYAVGSAVTPALSYFGGVSVWLKTASTTGPYNVRVLAGMADNGGPIAETLVSMDVSVNSEWQRVSVPFSGRTITAAPVGTLRRCIQIQAAGTAALALDLFRAVIRPTYAETQDTVTNGTSSTVGRIPVIPKNMVQADRLLERQPGGASNAWTVLRGPVVIRDYPDSDRLLQWDDRAGGIDLGPCRADRELMIEYWGTLEDGQLATNVVEEELPINGSVEALACITAALAAGARGQTSLANQLGLMQPTGLFNGQAGGLVTNLVNVMNKAQQSEPVRRAPYFGMSRYPGISGNIFGGWPRNSA